MKEDTMDFANVNWLAVLACVVFSMVSGSFWFGPRTFFPIWWSAIGKTAGDKPQGSPLTWILLIGASAVQALIVALLIGAVGKAAGGVTLGVAFLTSMTVWLGIVAPAALVNKLFAGHFKAWALEMGDHLINYIAFGVILGLWR
jgi:Protein of unknown function (DUF1761)